MTTPEIDFAKVAATVIEGQVNNAVGVVSKGVRTAITRILAVINKDLTQYTAAKIKRCSFVKTPIINRDRSTYIYDLYVQTRLKERGKIVGDDDFIHNLRANDSVVISGNAGSGKSMLMRYLFLKLCDSKQSKIPLFFELRDINTSEKKNLQEFLYYNLIGSNATITEAQFSDSLKAGVYSLILDGFDEINFSDRKEIEIQIRKMREQCPDLQLIVSSRPDADRRIESWHDFRIVYVQPMAETQAAELINKLEYDTKVKEKFLREAKATLFKSHNSFLSNPLLCIMMLVTFEQTGHIPTKRHVFYERAFDALFSLHDTSKEGVYKRKTYSDLSIDDFRKLMSAFCIVTYLKELFVFSRSQFRDSLLSALKLEQIDANLDDLTNDLIESTCLIQVEGTEYVFTHRSFQEYFAAVYISRSPAVGARKLLDRVVRRTTDDVIQMAHAINRSLVEREWVIPTLSEILAAEETKQFARNPFHFIEKHVGRVMMIVGDRGLPEGLGFRFNEQGMRLFRIFEICNELTSTKDSPFHFEATLYDKEEFNSFYNQLARNRDERLKNMTSTFSGEWVQAGSYPRRAFLLGPDDYPFVINTTFLSFVSHLIETCREVLSACDSEARNQEDILANL